MSNSQPSETVQNVNNQQSTEPTNSEAQEQDNTVETEEYKEPIIKSYTPTKQSDGTFNTEVDLNDLIEGGVTKNNIVVQFRYKSNKGTYSDWSDDHQITVNKYGHFGHREGIFKDIRLSNKYKGFVVTNKITILPLTVENFMDLIPENHNIHSVDYELWLNRDFNNESNRVSSYKVNQYFGFRLVAPSFILSKNVENDTTVYLRLRINYTHKDKPTEVINGDFWATDCKFFNINNNVIYTTAAGLMLNKEHPYVVGQTIYKTGDGALSTYNNASLLFSLNKDGSEDVNANEWYKQAYINYTGTDLYLYNASFTNTQNTYNNMVKNAKEFEYTSWGEPLPIFYTKLTIPQGHGLNIPEGYYAQFNEWVKISPGGILHEIKDLPESINKGEPLTFKVNITHSFIKELDKLSSYTTNNGFYYWMRTSYQYNTGSGGIYISGNPDNLTSKALIDNISPNTRNYSPILNNTTLNKPVYKEYDVTIQSNTYNSFIGSDGYLYLTGYFNNGGFTKGVGKIHKVRIINQDT